MRVSVYNPCGHFGRPADDGMRTEGTRKGQQRAASHQRQRRYLEVLRDMTRVYGFSAKMIDIR